ncbi:MAG: phage tail protein [Rhodocyclaceae bacterium]|nr:phage tail protein [Rhodocyclaceae bacterium]
MDPFIGEIRILPYTYAPQDWADCSGAILPISQNTALFSVLGVSFGGDGRTNFMLPNLQGATPLGTGNGPGLSPRVVGEQGGTNQNTLQGSNLPQHGHTLMAEREATESSLGGGNTLGAYIATNAFKPIYSSNAAPLVPMGAASIAPAGQPGPQPAANMQPYLVLRFCIALQGVYPVRS